MNDEPHFRHLNHNALPLPATRATALQSAVAYLGDNAAYYRLSEEDLKNLPLVLAPRRQPAQEGRSFRLETEKTVGGITSVTFVQTYAGVPVWEAGIGVTLDVRRQRILGSISTAFDAIDLVIPKKWPREPSLAALKAALGISRTKSRKGQTLRVESERMLVYHFEERKRTLQPLPSTRSRPGEWRHGEDFVLPLAKLPRAIKDGSFYFVRELIFHYPLPSAPKMVWRAFVEIRTGAVLRLRAFGDNATGRVFIRDPITKGGTVTSSSSEAALDFFRDPPVTLDNLNAPVAGAQSLQGSLVSIEEVQSPTVPAPTAPSPFDFSFGSRTNNFGAVNAYYHSNGLLQLILDMGFGAGYFGGTVFPVPVDHRGWDEPKTTETAATKFNAINAHCLGDSTGITSVDYELGDVSDLTIPITALQITADHLVSACDNRITLHELGGHGVLYCHVGAANLRFAHSAGDSIAVILNDPGSAAPDRFESFPFTMSSFPLAAKRFHNRTPAAGWGWQGNIALNAFDLTLDRMGYKTEQILSTTLFRLYRSMGGDSPDLSTQQFAARFAVYIIFKAIGTMTTTMNPATAGDFEQVLEDADADDWNSLNPLETHAGGAYMKVIRWAFEKQGLFQLPGTATPNNNVGSPPPVDVYIDDGRHGEYDYQPNHWSCQDIWNRNSVGAGGGVHEEPIVGQTNYAYVRIKNRGYQGATGIVVKGFHCFPGVGLVYPTDWMPMDTPQLTAPDLAASDSVGEIVGPFEWVPSQAGHECMFFSVSATDDPGNIDGRVTGPIPEWRLVPHDNNIGQRNVAPVAAGFAGLVASFERRPLWIRNTFARDVRVEIEVKLPEALRENKWQLRIVSEGGNAFTIKAGERRKVLMEMVAGTAGEPRVAAHERIELTVKQDGIVVGGMTYYVDPSLRPSREKCVEIAGDLLKCLCMPFAKVKAVRIRRVSLDIDFEDDDR